jgi:hypothetical protein
MQHIMIDAPVLPGCVTTAWSRCGKHNCACRAKPPRLHGPYYRWTGFVDGKRTTRTLSKDEALECKRRIRNFRRFQKKAQALVRESFKTAPWITELK